MPFEISVKILVCKWLESLNFGEFKGNFKSNRINGVALLELNENDLKNDLNVKQLVFYFTMEFCIEVSSQGSCKAIMKEITVLKLEVEASLVA